MMMMVHTTACFPTTAIIPPPPHRLHRSLSPATMLPRPAAASSSFSVACASDATPDLLAAAKHTVDNYIRDGMVIGLGSGRASGLAIHYLGGLLRDGAIKHIVGIPTSTSSASEATKEGIALDQFQESLQIDLAFDDADIVEEGTLAAVIGRRELEGGESILQEKLILKMAANLVYIVDEKQYAKDFDGSIPVLVKSGSWMQIAEEIDDLFLGDAEVWRRPTSGQAGPMGGDFPLVTREGHHILDVVFTTPILDLAKVANSLDQIDGVVDHGIVSRPFCRAIIASGNGILSVDTLSRQE